MRAVINSVRTLAIVALIAATGTLIASGSVSSAATSGQPGPCTTYEVLAIGPQVSPATQEQALTLKLTNPNKKSCVVDSYPTLMFWTAKGQVIEFKYSHTATGGYEITKAPPKRLMLKSHHSAYVLVAKSTCVGSEGLKAASVGISVPWADSSTVKPGTIFKTVKFSSAIIPGFTACLGVNAKVDNTVAFSPLELSFSKTL
jgi:hypothetical protein